MHQPHEGVVGQRAQLVARQVQAGEGHQWTEGLHVDGLNVVVGQPEALQVHQTAEHSTVILHTPPQVIVAQVTARQRINNV